jgi:hypothetical protein
MDLDERTLGRLRERRLYLLTAAGFALLVMAGFARTYYLKGIFEAPPLASILVHMHGAVMTAWVVLFASQVWLIRSRKIRMHQAAGYLGVGLAVLVVVIGFFTSLSAAKNGSASAPPDVPPLAFMIVPMTDLVLFSIFFGLAVYFRKKPAIHKRMMLLTAINFLPPAAARLPIEGLTSLGPLFFFGLPTLMLLAAVGYDTWHNRRLNKPLAAGALLLIVSYPARLAFSGTEAWMNLAGWLTGFALV